jgi:hypothetical protein
VLHALPGTRMIFEPFHARTGFGSLAESRYTYVPDEAPPTPVLSQVDELLSRSSWNPWIEQFNSVGRFTYSRRLVKEVRINLLLPALLEHASDYRYVMLLRHPAAVAQSQVAGGWNLSPERFFEQPALDKFDWMGSLRKLNTTADPFERNLLFWAIENRVAIDAASNAGIPVVMYENLCMQPEQELARLESYLEVEFPGSAKAGMTKASWSSSKAVSEYSLEQKISGWQSRIDASQKNAMLRILEASGLDAVYGADALPITADVNKAG